MSAVLAVFRIEVSQLFYYFDALSAASPLPLIYEGFRPRTGIYYVAQVLPNPLALSTFPDGRTISSYFEVT